MRAAFYYAGLLLALGGGLVAHDRLQAQVAQQSVQSMQMVGQLGGDACGTLPFLRVCKINGNAPGGTCPVGQFVTAVDSSGRVQTCASAASPVLCNQNTTSVDATGATTEKVLRFCTVPANTLQPNGTLEAQLEFAISGTGSVTKTMRAYLSSVLPTVGATLTTPGAPTFYPMLNVATTVNTQITGNFSIWAANRNATNVQLLSPTPGILGGLITTALVTGAIDTTAVSYVVLSGQVANAADHLTAERFIVKVYPSP